MTKITIEIERNCVHECDEIRDELSEACREAALYESRYSLIRNWMIRQLPPGNHEIWSCQTVQQFDSVIDKLIEDQE